MKKPVGDSDFLGLVMALVLLISVGVAVWAVLFWCVNNASAGSILVDPYPSPIAYPTIGAAYPSPVEPIATITPEQPVVWVFNELQVTLIKRGKATEAIEEPEIERIMRVGRGNKAGRHDLCGMQQLQVGFRIIDWICK